SCGKQADRVPIAASIQRWTCLAHGPLRGGAERFVAALLDELPHLLHVLLDLSVVSRDQRPGHAHRIAKEKALIKHLPCSERRNGSIPGKPEQRDPLERIRARGLVVLPDVIDQRSLE